MKKRGRPCSPPGTKLVRVGLLLREAERDRLMAMPRSERQPFLRGAIATAMGGQDEVITKEWLRLIGFQEVHMNPKYNGGFFRYYLPMPASRRRCIVVEVGAGIAENVYGFSVWLDSFHITHATTIAHLEALCKMTCGMSIAEAARYEFNAED